MMRLSVTIFVAVSTLLILGVTSHKDLNKRGVITVQLQAIQTNDVIAWICDSTPMASNFPFCQITSTTTQPPTTRPGEPPKPTNPTKPSTTPATDSPSYLESAHWCRFSNGTYLSRGYTFMNSDCDLCQCTQMHDIRCVTLQCMPTYCIDNSTPRRRPGQCCSQCAYETNSTQCVQSGVTFPHGTMIRSTSDKVQCWCHMGSIECRKMGVSVFSGLDVWGEGTAVYVIIVVICVILLIGSLICGGCSLLYYYYYYYYNQQSTEQAYWNNAGWQPMGEEEQVADANAEQKQAEAEQSQHDQNYPTGFSSEYVPPPYALYNGTYDNEQANKEPKFA